MTLTSVLEVGTRLIHNGRGSGTVVSFLENNQMVVEFDANNKLGTFDRDSENFIYEETGDHLVPLPKFPLKLKSARDRWRESGNYWPYGGHEEFFKTNNFRLSLAINPQECWWLVGYIQTCGKEVYHEPVPEAGAGVQQRGPTRHNYFPDPRKLALDQRVGEFFDFYRTGFVQINSEKLYNFLDSDPSPVAPAEYQDFYQAGRAAGLIVAKQDDTTLEQF